MAIKITTGAENYQILDTGSVITYNDEPLIFELAAGLKIIIRFALDKNVQGQKMDYNVISNMELELLLTNFNSSLGTGNVAPLPVAKIDNRQVYLNFMVYSLNESSNKTVHYTWYLRELKEEVQNG